MPVRITGKTCWDYRETPVGITGILLYRVCKIAEFLQVKVWNFDILTWKFDKILCKAGWPSGLRRQSHMQEVVGSNPRLGRIFFYKNRLQIPVQRTGKPLYRLQGNPVGITGNPCTDFREALVQITGKPCKDYRGAPVQITGKPCIDYRENPVGITGNPCRDYRETPVGRTGKSR